MHHNSAPVVFICIPTYKGAAFIGATIDSVLAQSYPHFQVLILDDQSPDDTRVVVEAYRDPRVKYVRNEKNLGPQGNWNKGLELAQGKYFKLLPHDDLLAPDSLTEQVAILESDTQKKIALVFGFREIIKPNGQTMMRRGLPRTRAGVVDGAVLVQRCVRAGTNLIGEPGNGLFRSELIAKIGQYDASFPYLVDLDYWFRVLLHGDAHYTASHSSSFRVSPGSWSVALGTQQYTDFKGLMGKFAALPEFGVSAGAQRTGLIMAKFNMWARALVYRFVS